MIANCVFTAFGSEKTEIVRLENLVEQSKYPEDRTRLYYQIFNIQLTVNDTNAYNTALKYYKLAKLQNDQYAIANSYKMFAQVYQMKNMPNETGEFLFKELEQRIKIRDIYGQADVNKNLGEYYRSMTDYSNAIKYIKQALAIYQKLNNPKGMASALNRLGAIYNEIIDNKNRANAIYYARQSLDLALKLNDKELIANNYTITGSSLLYFKKYDQALDVLDKAMELIDSTNNKHDRSLILKNTAYAYYAKKDYTKAIELANCAYHDAVQSKTMVYQWLSADILVLIYEELNQIDSAYKYLKISMGLKTKIYTETSQSEIAKAEAKYQQALHDHDLKIKQQEETMIKIQYSMVLLSIVIILTAIILRYRKLKLVNQSLSSKNRIIEDQKDELSKLNATKDKFFSILAHDLKNPLGNFRTLTSLFKNEYIEFSELEKVELIDSMHESAHNIYALLENLLTWSQSQRGAILMSPSDFNLKSLASETVSVVKAAAEQKKIKIVNNIDNEVIVFADINMVDTVIRNLLSNAVKFTSKNGLIELNAILKDDGVTVSIKDNGVGIRQDKIEELFKIESQHTTKGTQGESGTGLGLVLCNEFIRLHNGRIWVESTVGVGSEFFFHLPQPHLSNN